MKLVVPVNVCIKRFYRTYAYVDENATDEQICNAVKEMIYEEQDKALTTDPDLEIEDGDIEHIHIDHDGEWSEEDDEEILKGK